jgi:hypothetical protein
VGFDDEAIHHFRTTSKKLRSLLRLQKGNKNKLPFSFLKFYHTGGDLRNLQLLMIGFTNENANLPRFMLWLSNGIAKCQRDWLKHHQEKAFKALRESVSSLHLSGSSTNDLQDNYREKTEKIKEIMATTNPADEELHQVRKFFKDIFYTRQWSRKHWRGGWDATKKFSLAQLNKLSGLAGAYNDSSVGLQLLADYLKDETDKKAIQATKKYMIKLDRKAIKSKKQLSTQVVQCNISYIMVFFSKIYIPYI